MSTNHQRLTIPTGIFTTAIELYPRVADGVAGIAVVSSHHIEEVGLDIVAGISHIGIAHDDSGALVDLRLIEHIVAELAELAQYGLHIGIALGVATAAVSVHMGDVDVNDHIVRRIDSHLIMAEAFLDAGVGTIIQVSLLVIVFNKGLARRTGR